MRTHGPSPVAFVLVAVVLQFASTGAGWAGPLPDSIADLRGGAKKARQDFGVPSAPAFELLQTRTESILRPGTTRELAVLLGSADLGNFAIEVAPTLLLKGDRITLRDYRDHRFVHNLRLSGAVKSAEGSGSQVAFGVRMSFLDRSDPRTDERFLGEVSQALIARLDDLHRATETMMGPPPDEDDARLRWTRRLQVVADSLKRSSLSDVIDRLREEQKKRAWNAPLLELGLGVLGSAADSVARRLQATRYAGWATGAFHLTSWDQILIGANASTERAPGTSFTAGKAGLGLRAYVGTSDLKGMIEMDSSWKDGDRPQHALRAGIEPKLLAGLWVELLAGVEATGGDSPKISHRVSLKYGSTQIPISSRE